MIRSHLGMKQIWWGHMSSQKIENLLENRDRVGKLYVCCFKMMSYSFLFKILSLEKKVDKFRT